ncbi:hypothetical protein SPI_00111 [Niveomyces insectorum RCEF 264]|uniref:Apple domain-containing protein n=1 Tax=Niveomyces insectorum RCEF 264 TaxID=1081102 RepID=A0A167ZUD0_9HYPO|nr:hypothetical protein SPI_00111 [Niveomyces insectorum RCEF 264]
MWSIAKAVPFLAPFASLAAASRCRPSQDLCRRAVEHPPWPLETIQHRADCHSFFSVTVIPPTSTLVVTVTDTVSTVVETVATLSSTVTDTITVVVSSTETDVTSVTSTLVTVVTSTSTSTTTTISTVPPPIPLARRSAPVPAPAATTITASRIPLYAREDCSGTSLYSSACAQWGVQHHTTTRRAPRTTLTVTETTTLVEAVSATSTATVDVSSTTTRTVVESSEARTTRVITSRTVSVATATATSAVPWCVDNSVLRAHGCQYNEFTTHCGVSYAASGSSNVVVFRAQQASFQECLDICDANGFCSAGTFDAGTGLCTHLLYNRNIVTAAAAPNVASFLLVDNTYQNACSNAYECPYDWSAPECCGGSGCPFLQPPY